MVRRTHPTGLSRLKLVAGLRLCEPGFDTGEFFQPAKPLTVNKQHYIMLCLTPVITTFYSSTLKISSNRRGVVATDPGQHCIDRIVTAYRRPATPVGASLLAIRSDGAQDGGFAAHRGIREQARSYKVVFQR